MAARAKPTVEATDWIDAPFDIPEGCQEYVIGDVHGCLVQFEALLDVGRDLAPSSHLTLLGDLIDRGPDSLASLRTGTAAVLGWTGGGTYLPGNHEQLLLGAAADEKSIHRELLIKNGGAWTTDLGGPTLLSGLARALGSDAFAVLSQDGALLRPQEASLVQLHRRIGNIILVHAGVNPDEPDPEQWIRNARPLAVTERRPWHPLWIREAFLSALGPYGDSLAVVHGLTWESRIPRSDGTQTAVGEHRPDGWRLGLDGGSFGTGVVAAAVLERGRCRTVTASLTP